MKLNRILKYAAVSALVVSTGVMTMGCTDNFENLNTDPYEVDPDELPFSAQFKEPFSYVYAPQQNLFQYCFNLNIDLFSGYFMTPHNFNGSGNVDYALNRGFCGGMYENVYLHIFNNTRRLIASCDEQGLSDYGAMMRVVQAYAIQMLTDAYGPVAYSSVIEDPTGGASFSYDTQESVYNALFTLVDEAIAGFKGTASVADMQAFDYWCNGDIALWKKVANQLKLRLAMRIVKVNPTLAKQKAEEAVQGGVLTSADRDILINQGLSNELTRMFEWGDCGMNASLITMLEGFKDPRLPLYVTKNQAAVTCEDGSTIEEGTKYLGVRGGCNSEDLVISEKYAEIRKFLKEKKDGDMDSRDILTIKGLIRRGEARTASSYNNIPLDRVHFLDLPFYETGKIQKNPISEADVEIVRNLLREIKPHQIFVAGDLADPHGTHRVCTDAVFAAVDLEKEEGAKWLKDCRIWMYRGAWAEWEIENIEMAVPISPEELRAKRNSILKHQSQMESAPFLGNDERLFWQRSEDRNRGTATLYDQLGLASYEAMEAFVEYIPL